MAGFHPILSGWFFPVGDTLKAGEGSYSELWFNNGSGVFDDKMSLETGAVRAFVDVDSDGDLDSILVTG